MAALVERERRAGRVIVLTNGVFDLLHPGHVRYLQHARRLGDVLIVAVNSDRSARGLGKGEGRPITPEYERAEMLAALACVDAVALFDDDTPASLIARLEPDVLVKGADWAGRDVPGRDIVEKRGGRIVFAPFESGYSTTAIVEKIRKS
jgi:D-glycero-beta-D-manno-heptose 1-phosphate adenylyltransferase